MNQLSTLKDCLTTPFSRFSKEEFVNALFDSDQTFWQGGYSVGEKIGKDEHGKPIIKYVPKNGTFFTPNPIDLNKVIAYNAEHKPKETDLQKNAMLRRGITQKTMGALTCVFAEFDEGTSAEQLQRLLDLLAQEKFPFAPTAIVHSGDHRPETIEMMEAHKKPLLKGKSLHMFWRLDQAVEIQAWKKIQIALIHMLDSDPALKDPCRSMRMGGVISDQDGPFAKPDFKKPFAPSRLSKPARVQTILHIGQRVSAQRMEKWSEEVFRTEKLKEKSTGERGRVFQMLHSESVIFDPREVTTVYEGKETSIWELAKGIEPGDGISICSPFHEDHLPSAKLFKKKDGQIVIRNYSSNAPHEYYVSDRNAELVYDNAIRLNHAEFHARTVEKKLNVFATDMGSGKTHKVQEMVKDRTNSILAITAKRSLVAQMSKRLKVEHYEELPAEIQEPRCAICINSLMRISSSSYDIVFIDEFEEVIESLFGGFIPPAESIEIMHKLRSILLEAKTVIIADANASIPSVETFMELSGTNWDDIEWINGGTDHRPCNGKTLFLHENLDSLNLHITESVKQEKRIFIAHTEASDAITISKQIMHDAPDMKVKVYHAKSDPEVLAELGDVDKSWAEADVVICSPVVSSGVSFDVPDHFDHIVVVGKYREGLSREGLLQQIGRVRNPGQKVVHAFFTDSQHDRPRDFMGVSSSALQANLRTRQFLTTCGVFDGKLIQTPLDILHFRGVIRSKVVHNIRSYNIRDLMERYWVQNEGEVKKIDLADDPERQLMIELKKAEKKKLQKELKEEHVENVFESEIIDSEEAAELEKNNDCLTEEQHHQLEKFKIVDRLGPFFEEADPEQQKDIIDQALHARLLSRVSRFVDAQIMYKENLPSELGRKDYDETRAGVLQSGHKGGRMRFWEDFFSILGIDLPRLFKGSSTTLDEWRDFSWSKFSFDKEGIRDLRRNFRNLPKEYTSGMNLKTYSISNPAAILNAVLRYYGMKVDHRQVRDPKQKGKRIHIYNLNVASFKLMRAMGWHHQIRRVNSEIETLNFVTASTDDHYYSGCCDRQNTAQHEPTDAIASGGIAKYTEKFVQMIEMAGKSLRKGASVAYEDLSHTIFAGGGAEFALVTLSN